MIIQSSTFSLFFAPNSGIRESIFKLEKHFGDFQKPFTLIPLPQDAPLEIPRIIANTISGHSQLSICGNNMQLLTRYDSNFNSDVSKCVGYVREKCRSIVDSLSIINEGKENGTAFYYSGLSMTLTFEDLNIVNDCADYLFKKYFKCTTDLPLDEVQLHFALVFENKYYINVMAKSNRQFFGIPDERGSLAGLKTAGENLQIVIDINDRYAFNHERNYCSSLECVEAIAKLTEDFISSNIDDFIAKGEIIYGDK